MENFAFAYWWLIFPLMWFVSGIVGMWFAHRRQQDALELMKTYAAQGRDPSEIAKLVDPDPGYYGRWGRGAWRYGAPWAWRYTPFWAWRRAVMAICVATGFWLAWAYADFPFNGEGFRVVAIIMTVIAAGAFVTAIASSLFGPKAKDI